MFRIRQTAFAVAAVSALGLGGCGSEGPELGGVTGTVTLDDRPLPNATVEFQPASGSPSIAVTDDAGNYRLMYTARKAGAMLGKHQVRISLPADGNDDAGRPIRRRPPLPARYHRASELTADVESGSNQVDFSLKSQ